MRTKTKFLAALCFALLLATGAPPDARGQNVDAPEVEAADLVLRNGKIVTLAPVRAEAEALAARGDTIVAIGSDEKIDAYVGPATRVIDLEGRLAMPGFIEGHGHYMSMGRAQMILDLNAAESWDEIVAMVEEAAQEAAPGAWILGRGWHQEKWDEVPPGSVEGVPVHETLSAVSPENPVLLGHASGHAAFANALALEKAGLAEDTPNPPGGEIVRDAEGRPTGMLRENAQDAAEEALAAYNAKRPPEEVAAERRRQAMLAGREALANGVTTFHDAGSSFETIDFFKQLADEDALPVRLYVMVRYASNEEMDERLPAYRMIGYGDHHLTVRSIKRQVDGALGAHGAWLLEPYADMPQSTGLTLEPVEDIARTAEIAIKHGYQLNTHAIGDRGNRETLDLYEEAFEAHPAAEDLRWRIEHAQHLHPDDIPRFAELGVIASMQGVHATSDAPYVPKRLGDERAEEGAYVWQDLWQSGALVTNGTDVPVEDISPVESFYATVTRRTADGNVFYPEQRLARIQALASYTLNNAIAAFQEETRGTLEPGKLADLVVLSKDILTVPEDEIKGADVLYTILGGEVVYSQAEGHRTPLPGGPARGR